MRLHAPYDSSVAVLRSCHLSLLVSFLSQLHDASVGSFEFRDLAANGHVVGLCIKREVAAEYLRIIRLVHVEPLIAALRGKVDSLCAFEVVIPVPLVACVLFDERYSSSDLLCSVVLYVFFLVAERSRQLEYRNAVFLLEFSRDDSVAEK